MQVFSNTSPLCNLAIIGQLPLLWRFYTQITIPYAVWAELQELDHENARECLEDARASGLIYVIPVLDQSLIRLLGEGLHLGESEAIVLAYEKTGDLLLMDEHDGRAVAQRLGIPITGVLGILRRAKLEGLIPSLKSEITRLRAEAHFFIAPKLEEALLHSVGEMS
ncbi:hypothetical protein EI77_00575 [Prosthecobacter fusiformis]|uniref:Nucleic acid-binding protein n=1 Tax=Prosthecobacter fusiformis TaxID=48464 RepID=A0A4R7SPX3_9BACT|nr:DUF3368 domain-containing protein [Prosthecobacter fusiformis]TDU81272.1 hypothetical protein EI77_00575 [Prosthecobacter fusiformis]